jgi:energy-coupling factor transporter ATP-binding protein EcfA2
VADAVLLARGFGYRYPEARGPALRGVDLVLEPGSFTVVAGESGSGKSTLLRAASGLVPHFHGGEATGEFEVGGLDVREHGPGELAAVVGTVLQDPESQVVMSGVRAELSLPLEHRGAAPGAVARAVEEAALVLGIAHLLDRQAATLSGGELQRVALAAALVHRPALLVLDEPTSQLDPVAGEELIWLLRRLNEEWGTAVLLAEHRLERCLPAADRVLALDGGRIVSDGDPAEFLEWAAREGPALATPGARLFSLAGLTPLPASVKDARAGLRAAGLLPGEGAAPVDTAAAADAPGPAARARRLLRGRGASAAVDVRDVWHELRDGPAILAGVDLRIDAGDTVALMGRNGAGKSTLLRHLKALVDPTRGRIRTGGDVALLLQNPGDYLVHDTVHAEASAAAIERAGLAGRADAHPRDLSGGERQRLALELVLDVDGLALACLDEPTRGMDAGRKLALAERLRTLASGGVAVLVATHDTEFASALADRVVLMGQGTVIADGPAAEVLCGGWHFATETARVLGGAGAALTPEQGAAVLERELVR